MNKEVIYTCTKCFSGSTRLQNKEHFDRCCCRECYFTDWGPTSLSCESLNCSSMHTNCMIYLLAWIYFWKQWILHIQSVNLASNVANISKYKIQLSRAPDIQHRRGLQELLISSKSDQICNKIFLLPSHRISIWSNRSPRSTGRSSKSTLNDLHCLVWKKKLFKIVTTGVVTGSNPNKSHAGLWCNRAAQTEREVQLSYRSQYCLCQPAIIGSSNVTMQQCWTFSFQSISNKFLKESTSRASRMR